MNEQKCLDCEELLENLPEDLEIGSIVECESCGAEMEVVMLDPLELKLIDEEK